jgi:hypothetical protein
MVCLRGTYLLHEGQLPLVIATLFRHEELEPPTRIPFDCKKENSIIKSIERQYIIEYARCSGRSVDSRHAYSCSDSKHLDRTETAGARETHMQAVSIGLPETHLETNGRSSRAEGQAAQFACTPTRV